MDFGAKKFTVSIEPFNYEDCKRRLLDYVYAAQPAKSRLLTRQRLKRSNAAFWTMESYFFAANEPPKSAIGSLRQIT